MTTLAIPCPACGRELKIRDRKLLGKKAKCPNCQHSFVLEESSLLQLADESATPLGTGVRWTPDARSPAPAGAVAAPAFAPVPSFAPAAMTPVGSLPVDEPSSASRQRIARQKRAKRRNMMLAVGAVIIVAVGAVLYLLAVTSPPETHRPRAAATASSGNDALAQADLDPTNIADITESPTKGKPIPLELIPAGARLFVHLRPSELWKPGSKGEEFRYCLGPLGEYVEAWLKSNCRFPPEAIEEVLMAWVLGARGTEPDFSFVVRLVEDAKKSDLLDIIGGERSDAFGHSVYISKETNRAGIIVDNRTFAMCPATVADEMASSIGGRNVQPDGVEALFAKSDRTRHLAVYFQPSELMLHEEMLFPANLRPLVRRVMEWFGEGETQSVLWSLHIGQDRFFSDVLVRNQSGVRPLALEQRFEDQLNRLPKDLVAAVQSMQPREAGKRQIIGRIPAMAKVVAMATVAEHGQRDVRLITSMPDRAAPNLAIGTLFAWDESTRTDFTKKPAASGSSGDAGNLPTTIAERLKKKIDVDFRRTPLQEAFAYIGDEIKVTFDIDGDALKLSGYTKNMPQEFKMDQVPATQPLQEILKKYDKMCLVVDEQKRIALITTFPVAEQKGLKPYSFQP